MAAGVSTPDVHRCRLLDMPHVRRFSGRSDCQSCRRSHMCVNIHVKHEYETSHVEFRLYATEFIAV